MFVIIYTILCRNPELQFSQIMEIDKVSSNKLRRSNEFKKITPNAEILNALRWSTKRFNYTVMTTSLHTRQRLHFLMKSLQFTTEQQRISLEFVLNSC